jgi:hypothetical protein
MVRKVSVALFALGIAVMIGTSGCSSQGVDQPTAKSPQDKAAQISKVPLPPEEKQKLMQQVGASGKG